jgi:hypothetical protein
MNDHEEKILKSREAATKYYYEHREEIRERARHRYVKKMEEAGLEPRPRGRPRKQKTIKEEELSKRDRERIRYYTEQLQEDDIINFDEMSEKQKGYLIMALVRERKRLKGEIMKLSSKSDE